MKNYITPQNLPFVIGGGVLLLVGLYVLKNGVAGAAAGIVKAGGDAATGTVVGIGEVIGIPATDAQKCKAAQAAGEWWEASKYCPAADFIGWAFTSDGPKSSGGASGGY